MTGSPRLRQSDLEFIIYKQIILMENTIFVIFSFAGVEF